MNINTFYLSAKDIDDLKESTTRIINKTNSPINITLKNSPLTSPMNSPERPNSPGSPGSPGRPVTCPTPASSPITAPLNNAKRVGAQFVCRLFCFVFEV